MAPGSTMIADNSMGTDPKRNLQKSKVNGSWPCFVVFKEKIAYFKNNEASDDDKTAETCTISCFEDGIFAVDHWKSEASSNN